MFTKPSLDHIFIHTIDISYTPCWLGVSLLAVLSISFPGVWGNFLCLLWHAALHSISLFLFCFPLILMEENQSLAYFQEYFYCMDSKMLYISFCVQKYTRQLWNPRWKSPTPSICVYSVYQHKIHTGLCIPMLDDEAGEDLHPTKETLFPPILRSIPRYLKCPSMAPGDIFKIQLLLWNN